MLLYYCLVLFYWDLWCGSTRKKIITKGNNCVDTLGLIFISNGRCQGTEKIRIHVGGNHYAFPYKLDITRESPHPHTRLALEDQGPVGALEPRAGLCGNPGDGVGGFRGCDSRDRLQHPPPRTNAVYRRDATSTTNTETTALPWS